MPNNSFSFLSTTEEKIFGISREQLLKEPYLWHSLIHPDDLPTVEKNQKKLNSGLSIQHEYRIIRPDGEIRTLITQIFPKDKSRWRNHSSPWRHRRYIQ